MEDILFQTLMESLGPQISKQIKTRYYRYLDDILCIWDQKWGDPSLLKDSLNSMNNNIEFICDQSGNAVSFLDIMLIKNTKIK
jgi:hypothetical protein